MSKQLLYGLNQGIDAMGLRLPAHVPEKLVGYLELLTHWNKAYNLTAIRNPDEMLSKHLLDSLAVMLFVGEGRVLDVGSGAGLPGIPLALALPDTGFVLLDSNGKKTRFLSQAKLVLGLDNVEVVNQRVEQYQPGVYFDTVIARAYAGTDDILKTTQHLHNTDTRILVMQGKLDEAVSVSGYALKQSHTLNVYGLDAERHLLEIIKTQ